MSEIQKKNSNLENVVIIAPNHLFRLDFIHEEAEIVVNATVIGDQLLNLLDAAVIILRIIIKTAVIRRGSRAPVASTEEEFVAEISLKAEALMMMIGSMADLVGDAAAVG